PSFSKPSCPSTTSNKSSMRTTILASSTSQPRSTTTCASNAGRTVCVDYIDPCGKWYGGCGPISCDGSFPKYTAPSGCTPTSTMRATLSSTTSVPLTSTIITATPSSVLKLR